MISRHLSFTHGSYQVTHPQPGLSDKVAECVAVDVQCREFLKKEKINK